MNTAPASPTDSAPTTSYGSPADDEAEVRVRDVRLIGQTLGVEREKGRVLVVGGGGAGLTASMLLATMGVDSILVSSLPVTSRQPKAHLLNQRAMEIMGDCGVAEAIAVAGTPPHQMSHTAFYAGFGGHPDAGRLIFKQEGWGAGGTDPDWVAASPRITANLPQIRLEPILKARAEELSPGRVRFGHEVVGLAHHPDGVVASVIDRADGRRYEIEADWVLACDGGRSIGEMVGITLEGVRDLARTVSLYLSADFSAWLDDPEVLLRWVWSPQIGKMVVLAPMGPTRWGARSEEWVVHLNYAMDDPRAHDDEAVVADLRAALGIGDHPVEVHLISRWTVGGLVADRFREGRVFVLGDAAHRHPPTGALGLTSAMHDAQNLCWKIAHVVAGSAGEALLDTYEPERRPVDQRNVARSLENSRAYSTLARMIGFADPSATVEQRWQMLSRLWSDDPGDADHRRSVLEAMAAQSQEFREHDVEFGYLHRSSAVVDDDTPPEAPHDFRYFVPSARPGSPMPHAWIEDWNGRRCSTIDLVPPGGFLVVAGEDGGPWCEAARDLATQWGVRIDAVRLGHARGDWRDPRLRWERLRGHGPQGMILVRPDRCVAHRRSGMVDDPGATLREVMQRVLARDTVTGD